DLSRPSKPGHPRKLQRLDQRSGDWSSASGGHRVYETTSEFNASGRLENYFSSRATKSYQRDLVSLSISSRKKLQHSPFGECHPVNRHAAARIYRENE